ncbi:MAG: hypothetical protein AABZ85_09155 [Thermodesulfobacteriota bacterium]
MKSIETIANVVATDDRAARKRRDSIRNSRMRRKRLRPEYLLLALFDGKNQHLKIVCFIKYLVYPIPTLTLYPQGINP